MPMQTALSTLIVTSNDPKGRKATDLFRAAYDKAGLDDKNAQRLNENPEFPAALLEAIKNFSMTNQFADEEVESRYGYLSGYTPREDITRQTNILRQLFPGVGNALEHLSQRPVPAGAEKWFAIPKWQTLAPTYGEAVEKVLAKLSETRKGNFENYCKGQLGPEYLRQLAKTEELFLKLGDEQKANGQPCDILVVAAQFGLQHRGRAVRRAREVMNSREFGLGAFAIGIMLLSHPERLQHYDDLWINCAGDEYAPVAGGGVSGAPLFRFSDERVLFGADWFDAANGHYGSVSAFLPQ